MQEKRNDLSEHHDYLTDMFLDMSAEEAWNEYRLNDSQLRSFDQSGFVSGIKILEEDQVEKLNKELEDLRNSTDQEQELFHEFHSNESHDPNNVLFHSLGQWRVSPGFHDVLWNPKFVIPACQLLGNKAVRFWHDQLFCKPAKHGGVVAWHQDYSYWVRTTPMQHLTCWVGLDNATSENGCLHYVPGSHKWDLLETVSLAGNMESIVELLSDQQIEQFNNKVAIEMPKGHGTFHHPLLLHGSYENRSNISRRAFVLNAFADGTISNADDPLLKGMPVLEKGSKLDGQFFPMLFNPSEI